MIINVVMCYFRYSGTCCGIIMRFAIPPMSKKNYVRMKKYRPMSKLRCYNNIITTLVEREGGCRKKLMTSHYSNYVTFSSRNLFVCNSPLFPNSYSIIIFWFYPFFSPFLYFLFSRTFVIYYITLVCTVYCTHSYNSIQMRSYPDPKNTT